MSVPQNAPAPRPYVCALIPAYNEADRISKTIAALRSRPEIDTIVLVDDGSNDDTANLGRLAGAQITLVQANQGKGAALAAAYAAAPAETEIFLLLDADLGASAAEAAKLLRPILLGEADMAIGMLPPDPEFAASGRSGGMGIVVRLANWGIQRATGKTFRQPLSGQRAIRREVLEKVGGSFAAGYGVEVALTIRALRAGFRIIEVDTHFRHKVTASDFGGVMHRLRQLVHVARSLAQVLRAPDTPQIADGKA
jgi:glycosyltransferase involved in cell wall biosynthesis